MLVSGSVNHESARFFQVDAHNVVPVWAAWEPQYWQDRSPSPQITTNHQSLPPKIKGRIVAHCGGMTPKLYPCIDKSVVAVLYHNKTSCM